MRKYVNFRQHETDIIIFSLQFTAEKVNAFYARAIEEIGETHRRAITRKSVEIITEINDVISFLQKHPDENIFEIKTSILSRRSDVIRSALEIYKKEISKVAKDHDIEEYNIKISEIEKIIETDILKDAKKNLFEKYSMPQINSADKVELFISHSSKDKILASSIKDIITNNNPNFFVFLAHRDIPQSKVWREDILSHLENCSVLLAICTPNYICSTWGNQEVGIAFGKGKKIIPLLLHGTEKSKFGFLEALQGHTITDDNLASVIHQILEQLKWISDTHAHAIILAAGEGKQMGSYSKGRPKALLEVEGDATIFDCQIKSLKKMRLSTNQYHCGRWISICHA